MSDYRFRTITFDNKSFEVLEIFAEYYVSIELRVRFGPSYRWRDATRYEAEEFLRSKENAN